MHLEGANRDNGLIEASARRTSTFNEYWPDGQLKATRDASNNETAVYAHDAQGRLVSTTNARGQTTTSGYDPDGNLAWKADGAAPARGRRRHRVHRFT